jgi:hypothetical protein
LLDSIHNDSIAFDVGIQMLKICGSFTKGDTLLYEKEQKYSIEVFKFCKKLFEKENQEQINNLRNNKFFPMKEHKLAWILSYASLLKFNNKENQTLDTLNKSLVESSKTLIYEYISNGNYEKTKIEKTNIILIFQILLALDNSPDYRKFLKILSPYENKNEPQKLLSNLYKDITDRYINCNKFPRAATFELLSVLYATEYETNPYAKKYLTSLIDSSMKWNYGIYVPTNITDVLFKFCKRPIEAVEFVNQKTNLYQLKSKDLYWDLQCKNFFRNLTQNRLYEYPQFSKVSYFISNDTKELIWIKNLETINNSNLENTEKQLKLAKYYKLRGFYCYNYLNSISSANGYFENALATFEKIPQSERDKNYTTNKNKRDVQSTEPYEFLFFFPADFYEWISFNCQSTSIASYTQFVPQIEYSVFFNYIKNSNRLGLYNSIYGIECLTNFSNFGSDTLTKQVWHELLEIKKTSFKFSNSIETIFSLLEIVADLKQNKIENATEKIKKLKQISSDSKGFIEEIAYLLFKANKPEIAAQVIEKMDISNFDHFSALKSEMYLSLCLRLQNENIFEYTFYLLDKLNSQNLENIQLGTSFFRLTANIGGINIVKYSNKKFRNVPELFKPEALENFLLGTAESGNYYKAKKLITKDVSETKELKLLNLILKVEILNIETKNSFNCKTGKWDDSNFFVYEFGRNNMNNDFKITSIE